MIPPNFFFSTPSPFPKDYLFGSFRTATRPKLFYEIALDFPKAARFSYAIQLQIERVLFLSRTASPMESGLV